MTFRSHYHYHHYDYYHYWFTSAVAVALIIIISAASAPVVGAQFHDANFGQPKICPPFKCISKDQEPVPKWPYKVESAGCASSSGGMMTINKPRNQGGDDPLESCCHAKQVCLQTCGSVKHLCEEQFIKCGERTCESIADSSDQEQCSRSIQMQKVMSSIGNCDEYAAHQRRNCKCVSKDKAPDARANFLARFYGKHNPDDAGKAEKLASKADTVRKMSTLVAKLAQKYPEAIAIVEDPNRAMMDRILKQADEKKEKEDGGDDGDASEEYESDAEDLGTEEL